MMQLRRRRLVWAAIAMLGIAAPAALTWSITRLTGQRIGLTAQPLSGIKGLAPARRNAQPSEEGLLMSSAHVKRSKHRNESPRISAASPGPATTVWPSPPAASTTVSQAAGVQPAPAVRSQTSAAGLGARDRPSGGQGGDDSSGGGSSGPDD